MTIAQGVAKQIRTKRQSAKGTIAGTSDGQVLRRETGTFELQKESITTESEITSKRQVTSAEHGVKLVQGSLKGLLSPGTYADWLSALLMRDFAAIAAITGLSLTIAGTGPYTITAGSGTPFLTGGVKVGMVVRLTAGSFNAANLNKNLFVTGVTATVITGILFPDVAAMVAEGPIAAATVTIPGKVTYVPESGHTNIYHTVEEWYPDITHSERNTDVKITKADIALPGTGNCTISFSANGLNQATDTSAYYTAPTAESTTGSLQAANGALLVNGVAQAVVTDLSFSLDGKGTPADGVVGTNVRPDVFMGKLMVSGSFTAYLDGPTVPNLFVNATNIAIVSAVTAGQAAAADFMTFAITKVKLNSSTPEDGETGLKRTYSFTGTYNSAGGAALANGATSIQVQDSAAA